jgi:hypothetical protein
MAFRRERDDWSDFLRRHGEELRSCGVPDEVSRDRLRFLAFLEHGFDERGWARSPHAFFDARVLTDEQIARLADFVAEQFGEKYRVPIASRWQRGWLADDGGAG